MALSKVALRFAQRRSPAVISPPGGLPYRPFLVVLMDETHDLVLGSYVSQHRMETSEVAGWVRKTMSKPLPTAGPARRAQVILVEEQTLYESLRFQFRAEGIEVRMAPDSATVDHMVAAMEEEMGPINRSSPCLVNALGAELAGQLFRAAASFIEKEPWRQIGAAEFVELRVPSGETWAAIVMGSGGEEFGLVLYDSVLGAERARQGASASCASALNLSTQIFLRAKDHDLLDQLGLTFEPESYPWIVGNILTRAAPSPEGARHLVWALEHMSEFGAAGMDAVLEGDGYRLSRPARMQDSCDLIEAMAAPWKKRGKLSRKGREMASYFLHFLETLNLHDKHKPTVMERHRHNCQLIGTHLLAQAKRAFDPLVFLEPPTNRADFSKESEWKSYCHTWKLVGEHEQRFEEEEEEEEGRNPAVDLFECWLDVLLAGNAPDASRARDRFRATQDQLGQFLRTLPKEGRELIKESLVGMGQELIADWAKENPADAEMAVDLPQAFAEMIATL